MRTCWSPWTDDADLTQLATLGRRLKGHAQSRNKGADIFLADPLGRYIGRICSWRECYPGKRMSCDARHCGRRAFLHDDLDDVTLHEALIQTPPLEIWPKIVRRIELPADVESQLIQPIDTGRANSRWDAHRRLRLIGKTVGNDEPPQAAGIGSRWCFLGISAERLYRRSNCGFAWISAKGMRGMTDFGLAA